MAKIYTKGSTVVDEVLSGAERYDIKDNGGTPIESNVQINLATSVAVAGTAINAARLNNIETGIDTLDTKVADANDLLTTGGTTTAYTLTTTGAAALATGERFRVKFNATAGATPTLNRDSKGAKSLKYYDSTGAKTACTSSNIVANLITDVVYDGTDYVVMDPAGVTGGSAGLTNSIASVTTANVTGVAGTRHILDVSGMTANRNFVLPAGTAGQEIEVNLSVGDATYALILIGNTGISINNGSTATEWSRIFIKGETVKFVATSATNWQVIVNGRIACSAEIQNSGAQAIANNTDTKATLDELVNDNCSITDTTNSKITIRRSGNYIVTLHMRFDAYGGNGVADGYMYEDLTTVKVLDEKYTISGRRPTVLVTSKLYLEAGKAEYFYLYQNSGGSVNTYVVGGQKTLFSIYELL